MIKVTLRVFAIFREALKKPSIEIELDEDTPVADLLEILSSSYNLKEKLFDEKNTLRGYVNIMVNGHHINHLSGLKTKLKDGDEVAIFPPVAGG